MFWGKGESQEIKTNCKCKAEFQQHQKIICMTEQGEKG